MFLKEQMKKRIKNEKGLTLIELLAVVVILSIIAAIAVPAIGNIINNSRAKAVVADAQNAMSAANIYFTDNPNDDDFVLADTGGDEVSDYLETGTLTSFTVNKADKKIVFTADAKNGTYTLTTGVTLSELNDATVKKGAITMGSITITPAE